MLFRSPHPILDSSAGFRCLLRHPDAHSDVMDGLRHDRRAGPAGKTTAGSSTMAYSTALKSRARAGKDTRGRLQVDLHLQGHPTQRHSEARTGSICFCSEERASPLPERTSSTSSLTSGSGTSVRVCAPLSSFPWCGAAVVPPTLARAYATLVALSGLNTNL